MSKHLLDALQKSIWLLCIFFSSCQHEDTKPTLFHGNAMTMNYRILIGSPLTADQKKTIETVIASVFDEADRVYNNWNPESELSAINSREGQVWLPLSPLLEELLVLTDRLVSQTRGLYDPTITPIYQLWKKNLEQGQIPSDREIQSIKDRVGWHNIRLNKQRGLLKEKNGVSLDLGGIAKGFCIDRLMKGLCSSGFRSIYVEWGGEISALGHHPSGRPWQVYISRLENSSPDQAIDIVSLHNQAIATSGDYLQQWKILDEKTQEIVTYTHIINPFTLSPLRVDTHTICSATVLARDCTCADALATATMLFNSIGEATQWIQEIQEGAPEIQFWIVQRK